MKAPFATIATLWILHLVSPSSQADVAALNPVKDNTLYEVTATTTNSNGAGEFFFAGKNNEATPRVRRGLIAFDISAVIPAGSVINTATLTLYMSRSKQSSDDTFLHVAEADWGEGASDAPGEEGAGAPAMPGDATWLHRFYNSGTWATPGGDFRPAASATTLVGSADNFYTWTSGEMAVDVQTWLDDPATNFGWVVIGNESDKRTATQFASRENGNAAQRPVLTVDFTPPAASGACCFENGDCLVLSSNDCVLGGGLYQGEGEVCTPNPCPQLEPFGACCLDDGTCVETNETACGVLGGTFAGDETTCEELECPIVLEPFVDALPIPPLAQPVSGTIGGTATYVMTMYQYEQQLHRDLPPTVVWGFESNYPGHSIVAGRDQPVTVVWSNDLRDAFGNLRTNHYLAVDLCPHGPDHEGDTPRTVVHLHGGHVEQDSDGYPESTFLPGESDTYYYPNQQLPATIWYHDHALGITRLNVYMGLAGAYVITDDVEAALNLPSGSYDVPLIIQDRSFNPDGSWKYPAAWQDHFFGDKMLVNGKVWPYLVVDQSKYRFRVVNGCNSRVLDLALSTGDTFQQIGTDGGLLPAPVTLTHLILAGGERAEIVVDFAPYTPGTELLLTNSAPILYPGSPGEGVIPNVMKFIVTNQVGHTAAVPASLRPMEVLEETDAVVEREFVLKKFSDPCAGQIWLINGLKWDDITEYPVLGTTEIWSFINDSGVSHPMHMHLVFFQVLDRQPFTIVSNEVVTTGPRVPPEPNEAGWKDTVRVDPGEIVRVITRFEDYEGLYAYHCHILEHEDHEMMRQFRTVRAPRITGLEPDGSSLEIRFTTSTNLLYSIDHRDDLLLGDWNTFTSGIPGSGGTVTGLDTTISGITQRHYRVEGSPP